MTPLLSENTLKIGFPDGDIFWNPNTGEVTGPAKDSVLQRLKTAVKQGYYADYMGAVKVHNPYHDPHDFKAVIFSMYDDIQWPPELANIQIRWIEQPPLPPGAAY